MLCKQLIPIAILLLLYFLRISEGDKIWSGATSITAVQGQPVTMRWIVQLTSSDSSKTWTYAKVIQVQDGTTTDLMSLQKSGTKTINDPKYQSRESDLNLNVSQIGAAVTIMFSIKKLIRSTDEKLYKAMLGFSSDSSTYPGATTLLILERPHSTTITASPNQTSYCLNDRITITCASRAYPGANYSLYRNNQLVQSGGSSGVFAVSTALTDRTFMCEPYNTVGAGPNRTLQVFVKEPPKILRCQINEETTRSRTFVEGSKVTMMCNISGSEPLNVTWVRINASPPLKWNKRSLTFSSISRKEEGWYRMDVINGEECNATESATFHVQVNYKPVGTGISVLPNQSTLCKNNQIVITCKTEAKPPPEFSLYQNNQLIQQGSKSGSFSRILQVRGEIVLRCVPSNAVGSGQSKSLRVFVKEPPYISHCKVNNHDQSNITVNEGAKVTFKCEFSGTRPLNVTWTKGNQTDVQWNQWNLTLHSVHRNDHGIYRVTVYNGKECNAAVSKTFRLVVNYLNKLQVVGNNFNVFNKSTPLVNFEILIDAYPDVILTCQSDQLKEELISLQRIKKESTKTQFVVTANTSNAYNDIRLKCSAENEVDSQTIGFVIYKQVGPKTVAGSMRLVDQVWHQDFSDVNSEAYEKLRGKCMKMLYDVYRDVTYVQKWGVVRFTSGSVVLYFHLYVIADVSDPLSPLRIAVDKNGGFVGNLQIDPASIQKTDGADKEGHKQSQTTNSPDIIIAVLGVIVIVSLVAIVILLVLLLRAKDARRNVYDYPFQDPDGHHQGRRIPMHQRSLPDVPGDDNNHHQNEDHDGDTFYEQPPHSQPQTNIGIDNPTIQEERAGSTTSTEEANKAVGVDGQLKSPIPEEGNESSKEYKQLDRSTKLPPKDSRPALEQNHEMQSPSFDTHKYQNRKAILSKSPNSCDTENPYVGNKTEQQNESSEGYSRLIRTMTQLSKSCQPVSERNYEIPMPPSDIVYSKDQNQKGSQSQDNEAFDVDEMKHQEICEALKSTVDSKTELKKESSGELQSLRYTNETTA